MEPEDKKTSAGGGKFPNREGKGMALPEFLDDAGVNSPESSPVPGSETIGDPRPFLRSMRDFARENPVLVIAGAFVLLIGVGFLGGTTARRRKRSDEDDEE